MKCFSVIAGSCSSPLWPCSSRSLLPAGNGCDPVCVKAAPAQRLSSSDHWSPAPVAPVVLQLDSLQSFPDLWSAVSPQSGFSQWSGWAQWRSSHCPPLLCVQSAVRTHITITQWASVSPDWDFSNFSSSPDSPYETLQPLSAAEDLSLSAGSSAGTTSASPSAASAAQTNNTDATLYCHYIIMWRVFCKKVCVDKCIRCIFTIFSVKLNAKLKYAQQWKSTCSFCSLLWRLKCESDNMDQYK